MSVDIPLYVPTTSGKMSAMASLPESGTLQGPAVALLPWGAAERVRLDVMRDIAHVLADGGQPVISFDYPGTGMSPSKLLPREEAPAVLAEACEWFLNETGLPSLALAGSCEGARLSLAHAARSSLIDGVVAHALPLRLKGRKPPPRVRAGIAALDWVGPRLMEPLTRGDDKTNPNAQWNQELLSDISAAATRTRVVLVWGEGDPQHRDFLELKDSGVFPPEALDNLSISLLATGGTNLLSDPEPQAWLLRNVVGALSASSRSLTDPAR